METIYAPIVLFVYNRLYHTRRTLEALANNTLASKSDLFIFCDNAKNEYDHFTCIEVQNFLIEYKKINETKLFNSITIAVRPYNFGLAKNIVDGITKIVNQYGVVIVLEDDIITSPYTLKFLNEALLNYKDHNEIFHITAWNLPFKMNLKENVFLGNKMNCWGWATWKDRWQYFTLDSKQLFSKFSKRDIYKMNCNNSDKSVWQIAQTELNGLISTWDIQWLGTIIKMKKLCVNPTHSLTKNIGNDGSGTNCPFEFGLLNQSISDNQHWEFPIKLTINKKAIKQIKFYNINLKSEARKQTKTLFEFTKNNVTSLFPEFSITEYKPQIISLKTKITLQLYTFLQKIYPPLKLLNKTSSITHNNSQEIIEQSKKIQSLENYLSLLQIPEINQYSNVMFYNRNCFNISNEILQKLINIVQSKKPKTILELGCGITTTILAFIQKKNKGQLISIENIKQKETMVKYQLDLNKLNKQSSIIDTQINQQEVDGYKWLWYDLQFYPKINNKIDFLILDELSEQYQEFSTYAAIPLLSNYMSNNIVIFTDRLSIKTKKLIPYWNTYLSNKKIKAIFTSTTT